MLLGLEQTTAAVQKDTYSALLCGYTVHSVQLSHLRNAHTNKWIVVVVGGFYSPYHTLYQHWSFRALQATAELLTTCIVYYVCMYVIVQLPAVLCSTCQADISYALRTRLSLSPSFAKQQHTVTTHRNI